MLSFAAVAGYAAVGLSGDAGRLRGEGVAAQATVAHKHERRRFGHLPGFSYDRQGRSEFHLTVTYRYVVDGKTMQGAHGVDRERFDALQIGQTIQVRYLPTDPSVSEIDIGWTSQNGLWAGAASLVAALLAGALTAVLRRMPRATA